MNTRGRPLARVRAKVGPLPSSWRVHREVIPCNRRSPEDDIILPHTRDHHESLSSGEDSPRASFVAFRVSVRRAVALSGSYPIAYSITYTAVPSHGRRPRALRHQPRGGCLESPALWPAMTVSSDSVVLRVMISSSCEQPAIAASRLRTASLSSAWRVRM